MPAPNWLSGWLKMNSKHCVYSAQNGTGKKVEKCEQTATTAAHTTPSFDDTSRTARKRSIRQRSWNKSKSSSNATPPDDEMQSRDSLREKKRISRQVLKEAAFMADVTDDEPKASSVVPDDSSLSIKVEAKSSSSPVGLTVTAVNSDELKRKQGHLFQGLAAIFKGDQDQLSCQSCESLERKLHAALCDVEYLRFARLQLMNKDFDEQDDFGLHTESSQELEEIERRHKQHIQALVAENVSYLLI